MHGGHKSGGNGVRERNLRVLIDSQLEFVKHIQTIVARANRVLGLIKVSFKFMNKPMFLNLYVALVQPLLEYCVQVWSSYKRKHICLLEGVQRRATKLVPQLKKLNYDERLEFLGLKRLVDRRIRGDMIETYKIITGHLYR